MTHWAMVIDLNSCIGCKACIVACSQGNNIPEGLWRKYTDITKPLPESRKRYSLTRSCMHCEKPPCKSVCPTGATFQRQDGIVDIDYEKCVGCGYCVLACPYDARTIYRYQHHFQSAIDRPTSNQKHESREGVCTKCNFCADRIDTGCEKNLIPGLDVDATPLCVATCSGGALSFGDIDDPESSVSRLISGRKTFRLSTGIETFPSVFYLLY